MPSNTTKELVERIFMLLNTTVEINFPQKTTSSKPLEVMLSGFQVSYIISQVFIFFVKLLEITKMKIFFI